MKKQNKLADGKQSKNCIFFAVLLISIILVSCQSFDTNEDDPDSWPVSAVYTFSYDEKGNKLTESNDLNNDGIADVIYRYEYDSDGKLTGYDLKKEGINFTGVYSYNASGFQVRLIQTAGDNSQQEVWSYDNDTDGNRLFYCYDNGSDTVNADYELDENGKVRQIKTNTQETWKYTLDGAGKTLSYRYMRGSNETVYRIGTYEYDESGKVVKIIHKSRP